MAKSYRRIETKLIHAGEPDPHIQGAVIMPIFQSAMYDHDNETAGPKGVRYIRYNNTPNQDVLHHKLAALENAEDALVTGSGMAAISAALLAVLSAGDHLLVQDSLYGGTHGFITKDFPGFGISYDFIDADDPSSWESKLRPNTKAVYVETMTNPLLQVGDLKGIADFARASKIVSMIDNTFASPVNFRPPEWGYDVSLHSCTKYLNGHSDIVAGACIGRAEVIDRIRRKLNFLGGTLDPHAAFLLHRGMKTLSLRVACQNETALRVARFFEQHPAVDRVYYPGLESYERYARARELFDGFSGMLSFELKGGLPAAMRFMQKVQLPVVAPSLGGVETLITRPVTTSHSGMTPEERQKLGISDALIRLSVGIEACDELIEDFTQAME